MAQPEQHLQQAALSRAKRPGDDGDLARKEVEIDRRRFWAQLDAAQLQARLSRGIPSCPRLRHHLAADHRLGGGGEVERAGEFAHDPTVPQDHGAVGDASQIGELVRDEQHRDAVPLERFDQREEPLRLGGGERGGRLIQDHQPRLARERAGDGDKLALGKAE